MNDKIIARINKLIALTQSSNPNESAKAAEMAFKLMESYGISTKDLDIANLEKDLGEIDNDLSEAHAQLMPWEKSLASTLAKYFNCATYIQRKLNINNKGNYCYMYCMGFVGHESNRVTSITMYEWLRKAIWKEACQKYKGNGAYQRSFCLGVVNGINEKYNLNKTEEKNEMGLVIYDEVKNWCSSLP